MSHSPAEPDLQASHECATRAPVVDVLGHKMAVHHPSRDRFISASLIHAGCFEPFLTELIAAEVRPGDAVLDLGAHIGYYTLLLARLVGPGGHVTAIEPDPDNFALLSRNLALNGYTNRVTLLHAAATDTPRKMILYRSADNAGDHRVHPAAGDRPAVMVGSVAVDDLFRGRADGIDFVKVDVQGAEGAALDGMAGLLERSRRMKMLVEFWPFGLTRAGYPAERLLARLSELGFCVSEADEGERCVRRADPRALLTRYSADEEAFTNLWCVKVPIGPAPSASPTGGAS